MEGLASYHFNPQPYISYENKNIINVVTGKIRPQGNDCKSLSVLSKKRT